MTKDEIVNGPKLAASIISRMPASVQTRILDSIKRKDSSIALKIKQHIVTYENIAELTPQSIQVLIKNIEHSDLVISLKTASAEVKKVLFENMSQRKKQVVQEDFDSLPPTKLSEIEKAQKNITAKMDELITSGSIRSIE